MDNNFTITLDADTVAMVDAIIAQKLYNAPTTEEYRIWQSADTVFSYLVANNFECLREIYNDIKS
jgi:hypothetical protein